jgi:hypothetical protein
VEWRGHFVRDTSRPPSLVEKLLSGGGIKVTKGAWQVHPIPYNPSVKQGHSCEKSESSRDLFE